MSADLNGHTPYTPEPEPAWPPFTSKPGPVSHRLIQVGHESWVLQCATTAGVFETFHGRQDLINLARMIYQEATGGLVLP